MDSEPCSSTSLYCNPQRPRVRVPSGVKVSPKVQEPEIPKLTTEKELEILEQLEKGNFDPTAGIEQWFKDDSPPKFIQNKNLVALHGLFGSVPVNLGSTINGGGTKASMQKKVGGGVTTFSELDLDFNLSYMGGSHNLKRRLLEKNMFIRRNLEDALGVRSPESPKRPESPESDGDTGNSSDEEEDDVFKENGFTDDSCSNWKRFLDSVDKRNIIGKKLFWQNRKKASHPMKYDKLGKLHARVIDVNAVFETLKVKDNLGTIDINMFHPTSSEKTTTSLIPCPIEMQQEFIDGIYATNDLYKTAVELTTTNSVRGTVLKERSYSFVERRVHKLQKLFKEEEQATCDLKDVLEIKTNLSIIEDDSANNNGSGGVAKENLSIPLPYNIHNSSYERNRSF